MYTTRQTATFHIHSLNSSAHLYRCPKLDHQQEQKMSQQRHSRLLHVKTVTPYAELKTVYLRPSTTLLYVVHTFMYSGCSKQNLHPCKLYKNDRKHGTCVLTCVLTRVAQIHIWSSTVTCRHWKYSIVRYCTQFVHRQSDWRLHSYRLHISLHHFTHITYTLDLLGATIPNIGGSMSISFIAFVGLFTCCCALRSLRNARLPSTTARSSMAAVRRDGNDRYAQSVSLRPCIA